MNNDKHGTVGIFACQNIFKYTRISRKSQSKDGLIATVVVTGGTGFIGSHTVEEFIRLGHHVRCLVRANRNGRGWLEGLPVEITPCDFLQVPSLARALEGAEYVVHVAGTTRAKRKSDFFQGNVSVTNHLLDASIAAQTVRQFCYISSLTAVGPSPDGAPLHEESPYHPITPYGQSKLAAEETCRHHSDALPIVILRPPAVYGPRDRDILHMFRWINLGFMPVLGSRHKTLSLAFASELARAIAAATFSPVAAGKTYFVGDETVYEYSSLVDCAATLLGKSVVSLRFPSPIVYAIAGATQAVSWLLPSPSVVNIDKVRDLLAPHWVCTSKKIADELGFQTRIHAEEGLKRTLDWYRHQGWL